MRSCVPGVGGVDVTRPNTTSARFFEKHASTSTLLLATAAMTTTPATITTTTATTAATTATTATAETMTAPTTTATTLPQSSTTTPPLQPPPTAVEVEEGKLLYNDIHCYLAFLARMLQELAEEHDRQQAHDQTTEEPFPPETRAFINEYREYLLDPLTRTRMSTRQPAPFACLSPSPSMRISGTSVSSSNADLVVANAAVSSFEAAASFVVSPTPARVCEKRQRARRQSSSRWDSGFWDDSNTSETSDSSDMESCEEKETQRTLTVRRLTGQLQWPTTRNNEASANSASVILSESPVQTPSLENRESWLSWPAFDSARKTSDAQQTKEPGVVVDVQETNTPDDAQKSVDSDERGSVSGFMQNIMNVTKSRWLTTACYMQSKSISSNGYTNVTINSHSNSNKCHRQLSSKQPDDVWDKYEVLLG